MPFKQKRHLLFGFEKWMKYFSEMEGLCTIPERMIR